MYRSLSLEIHYRKCTGRLRMTLQPMAIMAASSCRGHHPSQTQPNPTPSWWIASLSASACPFACGLSAEAIPNPHTAVSSYSLTQLRGPSCEGRNRGSVSSGSGDRVLDSSIYSGRRCCRRPGLLTQGVRGVPQDPLAPCRGPLGPSHPRTSARTFGSTVRPAVAH